MSDSEIIFQSTTSMCYAYAAGNDGCEYVVARYDPPGKLWSHSFLL